jgi:RNA 2',3'-cyclic 3'-phosphodiesterase
MTLRSDDWGNSRLYLFARPPADVLSAIEAVADPPVRKPVTRERRHLTLLNLSAPGLPRDGMIAGSMRLIESHLPAPFRVVLDQLVTRADRALLGASHQPEGVRRCQRRLLDAFRAQGLDLPANQVAPSTHLTLGYDCPDGEPGMRPIDPISWQVTRIDLVLSHQGQTRHETLATWALPDQAPPIAA